MDVTQIQAKLKDIQQQLADLTKEVVESELQDDLTSLYEDFDYLLTDIEDGFYDS